MPRYWTNLFTHDTWSIRGDGLRGYWAESNRKLQREMRPGDIIFAYIAGGVGWVGAWQVLEPPAHDPDSPYGDDFPISAPVDPIVQLEPATAMRYEDVPADGPILSRHQSSFALALIQQSGREVPEERGQYLLDCLVQYADAPRRRDLDEAALTYVPRNGRLSESSPLQWGATAHAVFDASEELSALEVVRRAAARGLKGDGSARDAADLLAEIARGDAPFLTADGEMVRRIGPHDDGDGLVVGGSDGDPLGQLALRDALLRHREAVKLALVSELAEMDPYDFEHVVRQVMSAVGVERAKVTTKSGDGGVDVRGVLRSVRVITRPIAVQVKRNSGTVGRDKIAQLRGSLDAGEIGLFVTLSDFTGPARDEAEHVGRTPISLMNGEELAELLIEHQIGVRREGTAVLVLVPFEGLPGYGA